MSAQSRFPDRVHSDQTGCCRREIKVGARLKATDSGLKVIGGPFVVRIQKRHILNIETLRKMQSRIPRRRWTGIGLSQQMEIDVAGQGDAGDVIGRRCGRRVINDDDGQDRIVQRLTRDRSKRAGQDAAVALVVGNDDRHARR